MEKMNFLKGMGVGLVVGSAIGMATAPKKRAKSRVGKALRTVGDVIENVSDAMGM